VIPVFYLLDVLPVTEPAVTEGNTKYWPEPVGWAYAFFIHLLTDDERGIAAFILSDASVLWWRQQTVIIQWISVYHEFHTASCGICDSVYYGMLHCVNNAPTMTINL